METWIGSQSRAGAATLPAVKSRVLTVQERRARLRRRHRLSRAQSALGGVVWFAGSGAVVLLALGGMLGLR